MRMPPPVEPVQESVCPCGRKSQWSVVCAGWLCSSCLARVGQCRCDAATEADPRQMDLWRRGGGTVDSGGGSG